MENHTISDFYLSGLMGGQLIPNVRRARTLDAARALLYADEVDAVRFSYKMLGYAMDDVIRAAVGDGRIAAIYAAHGLTYAPPTW